MSQPRKEERTLGCLMFVVLLLFIGLGALYVDKNPDDWEKLVVWAKAHTNDVVEQVKSATAPEMPEIPEKLENTDKASPTPPQEKVVKQSSKEDVVAQVAAPSVIEPLSVSKPKTKARKPRAKTQVEIEAQAEAALAAVAEVPAPGSFAVAAGAYFSRKLAVDRLFELEGLGVSAKIVPDRVGGTLMWHMVVSDIFPDFPAVDAWAQSQKGDAPPHARIIQFNGLK